MEDQRVDPGGSERLKHSDPDPRWKLVDIVYYRAPIDIGGVNPWDFEWKDVRDEARIVVAHPNYPSQRHWMDRYRIDTAKGVIEFAAGEFSNLVYGFYVQAE